LKRASYNNNIKYNNRQDQFDYKNLLNDSGEIRHKKKEYLHDRQV